MATRTGAPYLSVEGSFCPLDAGGCGEFLEQTAWLARQNASGTDWPGVLIDQPCPNCGEAPLAHVKVTTADQIPDHDEEETYGRPGAVGNG